MISPARRLAYKLLCQIESGSVFSDDALNSESMGRLQSRDRRLTTEIVYGTLRWRGFLDYVAGRVSSRPWEDVAPGAQVLLRMSLYQMWQMDRIPDHALVHDAVELAKREVGRGVDRYLNGILRHMARTRFWTGGEFLQQTPDWVRASLPKWLWDRWAARYGTAGALEFALSLNRHPLPAFRLGTDTLEKIPFDAERSDIVPGAAIRTSALPEHDPGYRYQDEASQLVPHLLGDVSGWRIWDACAAPGGKTAILCALSGASGRVVASDLRKERVARLRGMLQNAYGAGMDLLVADAAVSSPFRSLFDAVLADVPCSGLGTLRRNPEIKWRFTPDNFAPLQKAQRDILESLSNSVRIGGRLLYSTCSTEPEENEEVIESFLGSHPGFVLDAPSEPAGIQNWTWQDKMVRTFPGARLWDGFFAALMVRRY